MFGYHPPTKSTKLSERCCDGLPPQYWTCGGDETEAPEPYLLKVLGDHTPVIMCETHRANSQVDADEALIQHNDIRFPRYTEGQK